MTDLVDVQVTDEELTAEALAADPDAPVGPDAIPFTSADGEFPELLPSWYMPTPMARGGSRRRAVVVAVVIVSLLFLNAVGMCITSGFLELP